MPPPEKPKGFQPEPPIPIEPLVQLKPLLVQLFPPAPKLKIFSQVILLNLALPFESIFAILLIFILPPVIVTLPNEALPLPLIDQLLLEILPFELIVIPLELNELGLITHPAIEPFLLAFK